MKACYCVFVLVVVASIGPVYTDSKLRLCHEIECPYESTSCTKEFKANADNTKLITSYICDGANGKVLLSKDVEEVNKQPSKIHQPYKITKPFLVL